jgi:CubicO group peptidase (beta-lactamase class C family)
MSYALLLSTVLAVQGADTAAINRLVEAELARQKIPGLSLAVLRGDSVVLSRGYGFANMELRVPASDSTVYQSGSMGKQFTAALVEMLVEQGRLRLDDSIVRWFPEGANVWRGVTVRRLLTHTAGIAEYTDSTFDYRKDYTEDELVKFAASRPLDFQPGERWSYSNTGYLLLGALIRRVSGQFYGDLLRDSVFRPLGMSASRVISEADIVPNRAAGYRLENGELKNQEWVAPLLNTTADGALYFTVRDLTRWAVALNHRRVVGASQLDTAWTAVRLSDGATYPYGFGWYVLPQLGQRRISHTGSWQGFKTVIARYPESRVTVIVLANLAEAQVGAIAYAVAGRLKDGPIPPPHEMGPLDHTREPPVSIKELLRTVIARPESAAITPRFRRFLSRDLTDWFRALVADNRQWTFLGCVQFNPGAFSYLGSDIAHECYARSVRPSGSRTAVSVFYTRDWRAAGVEGYGF